MDDSQQEQPSKLDDADLEDISGGGFPKINKKLPPPPAAVPSPGGPIPVPYPNFG